MSVPPALRRTNDAAPIKRIDNRDPHTVRRYELLAENMPSVLTHLRPMEVSSDGMLRYLGTRRRP